MMNFAQALSSRFLLVLPLRPWMVLNPVKMLLKERFGKVPCTRTYRIKALCTKLFVQPNVHIHQVHMCVCVYGAIDDGNRLPESIATDSAKLVINELRDDPPVSTDTRF